MNAQTAGTPLDESPFRSVHTQDVDEHAACLSNWNQKYDQLGKGGFRGSFEECWFKNLHIFRESLNRSVHQTGQSRQETRTFAIPVSICGSGWLEGERFDRDSVISLGPGEEFDFRTPAEVDYVACSADADALSEYAQQVEHRDLEAELRGRSHVRAVPEQAQALRALICTVLSLRATPEVLHHAQIRTGLEQGILAALFEAVSPLVESPSAPPSFNTRQFVVERARDYLFSHIDEPVSVAELCIKLRVSRRTLQYSFQDVFGLTPVQFLRAMRLNSVRRELKRAEAAQTTVGDVAARWGFFHLSHFATDYVNMFGELPSETLKKLH